METGAGNASYPNTNTMKFSGNAARNAMSDDDVKVSCSAFRSRIEHLTAFNDGVFENKKFQNTFICIFIVYSHILEFIRLVDS